MKNRTVVSAFGQDLSLAESRRERAILERIRLDVLKSRTPNPPVMTPTIAVSASDRGRLVR